MQDLRSRRYDTDFWGLRGGRRKPGRKKAGVASEQDTSKASKEQMVLDNTRDAQACVELLASLSADDLRARLLKSRYNFSGRRREQLEAIKANTQLDDNWLEEAAEALCVPMQLHNGCRRQAIVVESVVSAAASLRQQKTTSASSQDAERRLRVLRGMRGNSQALKLAKSLGMKGQTLGIRGQAAYEDLRQRILTRSCPEDLRLKVVSEFIDAQGRLPRVGVQDGQHARAYLDSALDRRYVSSNSGEQLSLIAAAEWQELFNRLPEADQPQWQEDPVMLLARDYYDEHGDLAVKPGSKDSDDPEVRLKEGLKVLRKSRFQDARDADGRLLRRQLSSPDIAAWEAQFPKNILWGTLRQTEIYVPGSAVTGRRHEWPRVPLLGKACACYLCGSDFSTRAELRQHWLEHHIDLPEETKCRS